MSDKIKVRTMAELAAEGKEPEILFWVGCAGSFDDRAKKITRAFTKLLNKANVDFAVLGTEESCTGDPAKRAGNEFLFQMQASMNIEVMNAYNVKKIVTTCPHCYNTFKNEYPDLGGQYEVYHHTELLQSLLEEGKLKVEGGTYEGIDITYHDPCYLGRGNGQYEAPRSVLKQLEIDIKEMKHHKENSVCCGAGGAQMFKEAEPQREEIFVFRTREALEENPKVIATACAFCNTMLTDGVKFYNKEQEVKVLDIAEILIEGVKDED
jgi:heterodisulfide reductase subunit D